MSSPRSRHESRKKKDVAETRFEPADIYIYSRLFTRHHGRGEGLCAKPACAWRSEEVRRVVGGAADANSTPSNIGKHIPIHLLASAVLDINMVETDTVVRQFVG